MDGVLFRLLNLTQNKTFMCSRKALYGTPLQQGKLVDERQEAFAAQPRSNHAPATLSLVTATALRPDDECGATGLDELRCGGDSSSGRSWTDRVEPESDQSAVRVREWVGEGVREWTEHLGSWVKPGGKASQIKTGAGTS